MNAPESLFLTDVQALPDARAVAIDQVGIRGLRLPLAVRTAHGVQHTVVEATLTVQLAADVKGTHMSRFVELLEGWQAPLCPRSLPLLHHAMLERLGAASGTIQFSFPYFIRKVAPVSGVPSLLDYHARLRVEGPAGAASVLLGMRAPVTSLCPCSKEISAYGAHNQRSQVTIEARLRPAATGEAGEPAPDLERLAGIAEAAASCEVYGILKRMDEKYVTERAYDNPRFVEDLVRDVALALDAIDAVESYAIEVENHESIHNHAAWARIARDRAVAARR